VHQGQWAIGKSAVFVWVSKNGLFEPLIYTKRTVCQDRLGTNMGKALKKGTVFPQGAGLYPYKVRPEFEYARCYCDVYIYIHIYIYIYIAESSVKMMITFFCRFSAHIQAGLDLPY
jgi:hypothetical protein